VLGKQFKRNQFILVDAMGYCGFGKLEKTRFGVTLLEQETWRA